MSGPCTRGLAAALPRALAQARALAAAGYHRDAAHDLYLLLHQVSPVGAAPDPDLADVAGLYVHTALAAGGRFPALTQWARYSYETGRTLHPRGHEATLQIGLAYATLLADRGSPAHAARVATHVSAAYTGVCGPAAAPTIAAQDVLAVSLHSIGRCPQARAIISTAWRTWVTGRAEHDDRSMSLLAHAGAIAASCGPHPAADDWLHQLLTACPPPAVAHPTGRSGSVERHDGRSLRRHHPVCAYLRPPATARATRAAKARAASTRPVGRHP